MSLGNNLVKARKKRGLSQEEVAFKLNVSRQTISKWELDETIPDIYASNKLAKLYNVKLEELVEDNSDMQGIEEIIKNTNEENQAKVDWTKAWSKKYPVLGTYQKVVDIPSYAKEIRKLLESLKDEYQYNDLDAMLVLKDILAHEWKNKNK